MYLRVSIFFLHFCKNAVLNIYLYLEPFYTYKKIFIIFLKFDHAKNHKKNGWTFSAEKCDSKNINNAHINKLGPPKLETSFHFIFISFYLFLQTLAKDNTELNTHVKVKK